MDKQLYQFKVVAKHMSVTAACQELHISQPALSRGIKKIENRLGVQLFERLPRGMILTPYGSALLKRVERMNLEYQFAIKEINALKTGKHVTLRIGADNLWAEYYMPELLEKFYTQFPKAEVRIKAGTISQLVPELVCGKLDVVLGKMGYHDNCAHELRSKSLTSVKFDIVARPEHPIHKRGMIKKNWLEGYEWIIYQQSDQYVWHINKLLYQYKLKPAKISLHTAFLDHAIAQMLKGNYLMYIPHQLTQSMANRGLKKVSMNESIHHFDSGIYYSKLSSKMPGINQFLDLALRETR